MPKVKDVTIWLGWAVDPALALRVILPLFLALPTHFLLPLLVGNPFTPFFLLSHPTPAPERLSTAVLHPELMETTQLYLEGPGDLALLTYSVVLFSFLQLVLSHSLFWCWRGSGGYGRRGRWRSLGSRGMLFCTLWWWGFGGVVSSLSSISFSGTSWGVWCASCPAPHALHFTLFSFVLPSPPSLILPLPSPPLFLPPTQSINFRCIFAVLTIRSFAVHPIHHPHLLPAQPLTAHFWIDYPHNHLPAPMNRYDLGQIAYWLQQALVRFILCFGCFSARGFWGSAHACAFSAASACPPRISARSVCALRIEHFSIQSWEGGTCIDLGR
ncbi:hypothetical protein B0H13DRAFT_2359696 [Mycena leptocephala]|nr:hypothetical protein B0H13DRAFT_2359696 [Mycena leptocephala]